MAITVARATKKRNRNFATGTRMADRPDSMPRRSLMIAALCSAAALGGAAALALPRCASAQHRKMTKERAEYQDEPKGGIMMCGTCTLFIPPAECKVVEGFVAITGWCNAFDLAD